MTTRLPLYIAGARFDDSSRGTHVVRSPWDGRVVGEVPVCGPGEVDAAVAAAHAWADGADGRGGRGLSRHERSVILGRARDLIAARKEELARLITAEAGLAIRETRYELGRAADVLHFASIEALTDDGEAHACDVSPQGAGRRIMTFREPLRCAAAITPFNHPLNTVAHKLAPAIAAGTPVVLKPSEKTPLIAIRLAEILYEAGLPGPMLSVVLGPMPGLAEHLVGHPGIEALTFTGSTSVGRRIAATAGYKRLALELGGNSELIVLEDADLDLAARLACEGAFRNSGQRCTAAKRLLVDRRIVAEFTDRVSARAREYVCGDPSDEGTAVGTVISEEAARGLEAMIAEAVGLGARLLVGGARRGALLEPTVLADVPRHAGIVRQEAFGPIAKIVPVDGLDDAIAVANDSDFGLSSAVVTRSLEHAFKAVRRIRTGMVNINEVPAFRTERSPFGGVKASGLGVKDGVTEAAKWFSTVKTFSLPW